MASGLARMVPLLTQYGPWQELLAVVRAGHDAHVFGLSGSLAALATTALQDLDGPILVISPGWTETRRLAADLSHVADPDRVVIIPPRPVIYGEVAAAGHEWEHRRVAALARLATDSKVVALAPVEAARQLQMPLHQGALPVAVGAVIGREYLLSGLKRLGYERLPMVEQPGQFSARGAVIDVFPPDGEPIRIELFDDTVDLLTSFDPITQRSGSGRSEIVIHPAREMLWNDEERRQALRRLSTEARQMAETLTGRGQLQQAKKVRERWEERMAALVDGRIWPGMDRVAAAFGALVPLTALFSQAPMVVLDDRERVMEAARGQAMEETAEWQRRLEQGDLLPVECETVIGAEDFLTRLGGRAHLSLSLLPHQRHHGQWILALSGRPAPRAHGQWDLLQTEIQRLRKARHRVVVTVKDATAQQALIGRLVDCAIPVRMDLPEPGEVGVVVGQLAQGFVLPEVALAVLTETELTGRDVRSVPTRRRSVSGQPLVRLAELSPGDYVVHVTHGIGRFLGVRTLDTGGQHKDYLHIAYAGDDTLYIPVDQLDLVQRYAGVEDRSPKLSRLGGNDWGRVKEKVRASVREMASELIRLYAARQSRPGFAFGPDTPWQQDFETAFPYEETPDQLRASQEIKHDMEISRPMDRLLLGDVGYGKTEVALRAAFKAIMAGKQVAILVPTTLLAEQHFATARARLAGFPIRVDVLSRFRSVSEQHEVLQGLADAQVDMVIGTHRLLGRDVVFKDLGLLVVDEEHRFGVAHKERIKQLKESVDVLTLSATPIPRTLHMAMIGIRDVSVIETPPEDRFPVETVVAEYHEDLIREAMRREIDRDGQVYYVQNRILAMDATFARLRHLLPGVRVAIAHGRMAEDQLEEVMARFLAQEYDILLATSIIESGLDIPNVNTLIVEDADRMGLAQLYQLRGRIGRSSRLAYAYFTFRPDKMMTPEAEQRLAAIRDFTELGAGYQIALRDLEIRGAGNLLGPEQHGFVAAVGFELYTQLLAEAVSELKGQVVEQPLETALEFNVNAYLPDEYVGDPRQKIALYKRMVAASRLDEVQNLAAEIEERYGPTPAPVTDLLSLARVRVLARELGLSQVMHRGDRLVFRLSHRSEMNPEALMALGRKYPGRLIQMSGKSPELGLRLPSKGSDEVLRMAEEALATMRGAS